MASETLHITLCCDGDPLCGSGSSIDTTTIALCSMVDNEAMRDAEPSRLVCSACLRSLAIRLGLAMHTADGYTIGKQKKGES